MELDYVMKPRWRQRVNWRLTLFLGLACAAFVWIFATFVQDAWSGGIVNHGDYIAVNLKALGQFPFNADNGRLTDIPQRFRELDGKRIGLEGFMYSPLTANDHLSRCEFVWNIQKCCFSGPPQVQERVFVIAPRNSDLKAYDYGTLVRVTGILHVNIKRDEQGTVRAVYELTPDTVTPIT